MGMLSGLFGAVRDSRKDIDAANERLLSPLNPEQYEAVVSLDNPLLVLSGAGTGKTKVLTTKIAYIIENGFALPSQILAVTFTNRAAGEMKTRLQSMVDDADDIWIGTFHYICIKILRAHADMVGLKRGFKILDPNEQLRVVRRILKERNLGEYIAADIAVKISKWKDKGYWCRSAFIDQKSLEGEIYGVYQKYIVSQNLLDFDDLLLYTMQLFNLYPDVLKMYQNKFKYLLADEYQDTNKLQCHWLRMLCPEGKGLCCVGDDDQSIYGWRGADAANILNFPKDFENVKTVKLERNYRSAGHIVRAAAHLIAHNKKRSGKTLRTDNDLGEKIRVKRLQDDFSEMEFVLKKIIFMHGKMKMKYAGIAVLMRSNSQLVKFREYFSRHKIPCKTAEADDFENSASVKKNKTSSEDAVNILTLHSAKGLEFDAVFLAGWREGVFPAGFNKFEDKEEERRLAYVGLTRARKYIYITYAAFREVNDRMVRCKPSRFIEELSPADVIML